MGSSLLEEIVSIVCGLITPRLILTTFGSTYNGVVSSASQFLNMINILTLGITASTRVALYKPLADHDSLAVSSLMKSTKRFMRRISLIVVIYAAALCFILPVISNSDLSYWEVASLVAIVSLGTFANYFFSISDRTLLTAAQASYVYTIANVIKTVLNTVCVAILIQANCSIYIVKLGSSIVFFLTPAILSFYVKKRFSLTNKCEPNDAGIKGRKATAFHVISNVIHDNVDVVTLTIFADTKIVSVYTVYYFVVGKVKSLLSVATAGMEAAFGDIWARKEMDSLNRNFRTYEFMLFTLTTIIFSCVGVLILPFVTIYTAGVEDINYVIPSVAISITIAEAAYCFRQPYLTLVYATGSFEETKWGAMIEAGINVVISVVLVNFLGIVGVAIGTFVANVFRTAQYSYYVSKNILHRSIFVVIWRFVWAITTAGVIVGVSLVCIHFIPFETTWLGWFLEALLIFGMSLIIALVSSLIFYRNDLKNLFSVGARALKRQK